MKAGKPGKLIEALKTKPISFKERMSRMKDEKKGMDMQAQTYFDSLPAVLQEQIVQSGVKLNTREDLENYCKNALSKGGGPDGRGPWPKGPEE